MIRVLLEADGALKGEPIIAHNRAGFTVGTLEGGMVSGNPSAFVAVQDPNTGGWIVGECSLRELQAAIRATIARHGDLTL